jgi:hypothetical protein
MIRPQDVITSLIERCERFTRRPAFPVLIAALLGAVIFGHWLNNVLLAATFGAALELAYQQGRRAERRRGGRR